MELEGGSSIHQRILKLKDVALGLKKAVSVTSHLAPASYDSAVDSLLALYSECKGASSLAKDKHILKFLDKCMCAGGYRRAGVCVDADQWCLYCIAVDLNIMSDWSWVKDMQSNGKWCI